MFYPNCKIVSTFFVSSQRIFIFAIIHLLCSDVTHAQTIYVTNNDGGGTGIDGSLNWAIVQAQDGDIIDCSPIAGQTIALSSALPALGHNTVSPTSPLTIIGAGVTIDGGNNYQALCLGQGSATISDMTIQNTVSQGGAGGSGTAGGGGGTGGGGALYVHSGTTMTISTIQINKSQAIGGAGGAGNINNSGAGGGGGGFGGGRGGSATRTGTNAGSAGGGGGNNGGTFGGNDGGVGSPNTFINFAGAGGGGEIAGTTHRTGAGGSNASLPATSGGSAGTGTTSHGAGAGGGGGSSVSGGSGQSGSNSIDTGGTGIGGRGGFGFGTNSDYGAGGGGGGGNGGGAGVGTSGGGGGFNGPGGVGGLLGGGGGASITGNGGNSGFSAGGGGSSNGTGGIDSYGLGGAGGSASGGLAGGGGGSGLGGAIFIQKAAALIVQDDTIFSNNSTTAGLGGSGSGANGNNGSSLGQDIFIQSGGSITFNINNSLTMSWPIEGAGLLSDLTGPGMIKTGTGTISLTGANSYLGDTIIQAGIFNLNGSVSGDLYIQQGSMLSGNGTTGGTLYNSGIVSPGNSIGITNTTNLYLYPTSIYNVELNSAGENDLIAASGFVHLDGGVVISPDDINFTSPQTYTIITAGSGVSGTFSSLSSSIPSLMNLDYNSFNIQLTYLPVRAIGLSGNALNAANAFANLSALPGSDAAIITNALLGISFDEMQTAFDQISPAQFSGPTEVQMLDAILVRYTYTKHLQKVYYNEQRCCKKPISFWMDGFAQWQNQENIFGYKDRTAGFTLGLDYAIHNWTLGAALSSTYDNFDWKYSAGSKADLNSYYGGLYGLYNYKNVYIDLAFLGAFNSYNTTREFSFQSIDRTAQSTHQGNELLAHLGFESWMHHANLTVTPYLNLDYVILHEEKYSETGADSLNLTLQPKNSMLFQGEIGISVSNIYNTIHGQFIPMLSLGYINQTPSDSTYSASFANSPTTFTGTGGNYERNLFVPRLAFMYQDLCDKVNIAIYYDAQVGSNYWAQDIVLDLTLRF